MKRRIQPIALITLLIILCSVSVANSFTKPIDNELTINIPIIVDDLNDFTLLSDNANVTSAKTGTSIDFSYNGTSTESINREQFIYTFDAFGNCTDFYITTSFIYNMSDINDLLTFRVFAGSYYFENGSYAGLYPDGLGGSPSKLIGGGIHDASISTTGEHIAICYQNDTKDTNTTTLGAVSLNGYIGLQIERDETGVYCTIADLESESILSFSEWHEDVNKSVNYLLLDFYSGLSTSNVSLSVDYLNATLLLPNVPVSFPSNLSELFGFNQIIMISVIISCFGFIILQRKLKSQ